VTGDERRDEDSYDAGLLGRAEVRQTMKRLDPMTTARGNRPPA
jgi:hypothetical protein